MRVCSIRLLLICVAIRPQHPISYYPYLINQFYHLGLINGTKQEIILGVSIHDF